MLQNKIEFGRGVEIDITVSELQREQAFDEIVELLRRRYLQTLPEVLLSYGTQQPLEFQLCWRLRPKLGVRRKVTR